MKYFIPFLFVVCSCLGIQAQNFQSPFKLSLGVDLPIGLNAMGLGAGSFILGLDKKPPTPESILKLDRKEVNRFDRGATYQYSKPAAYSSDACMYLSMGVPLVNLANTNARKDFGKIALMYSEVFVLNTAITNLLKETVARKRPLLYNPNVPMEKKLKKDNLKSFFSGHTSTTASMSFFFAYTFHMYNPGSKWSPMVWSLSAALPIVTGLLRYKAGKHYWTDIITGYVVGALVGVGVPLLHSTALPINRR